MSYISSAGSSFVSDALLFCQTSIFFLFGFALMQQTRLKPTG